MNERPTSTRRLNTNAGRSFSSGDWFSSEPWEPRIGDGQTVPLGGRWDREARRCEQRRSADPMHHAAAARPTVRELLYVFGVVSLVPLGWLLVWLVAT